MRYCGRHVVSVGLQGEKHFRRTIAFCRTVVRRTGFTGSGIPTLHAAAKVGSGSGVKADKDARCRFENVPLRPANLTSARSIGSQPNLETRWAISGHFLAALNLAGFMTGTFLKQSPPSNAIVFV